MARKSKKEKRVRYESLVRGIRKHLMHLEYFFIASVRYTPDGLLARLRVLLDDIQRSHDAYYAWQAALVIERQHEREARAFLRALDDFVAGAFGADSPKTKAMGVSRRKTGPKTVAAKLRAVQKAAATRELRAKNRRRRRR
jgi:hypothetical protein